MCRLLRLEVPIEKNIGEDELNVSHSISKTAKHIIVIAESLIHVSNSIVHKNVYTIRPNGTYYIHLNNLRKSVK